MEDANHEGGSSIHNVRRISTQCAGVSASKRDSESTPQGQPPRKRTHYNVDTDRRPIIDGHMHGRWLIESYCCSKVLGPAGRRLKNMKDVTKEPSMVTWISSKTNNNPKYRVFNCIGTPMGISKIASMFVKAVYDEPEQQLSDASSRCYDMKLLIPRMFTSKLAGPNNDNVHEIEKRSNSRITIDALPLPHCDEQCVHIYGVADAVQIAVYFTLKTLKRAYKVADHDPKLVNWTLYSPGGEDTPEHRYPETYSPRLHHQAPSVTAGGSSSNSDSSTTPPSYSGTPKVNLPQLMNDENLSQSIYTAYDIAKDSTRAKLRQMVQISCQQGTESDRSFLIENIRRVTDCSIETITADFDYEDPSQDDQEISLVIEGPPEDNALALFLIYRFLRKNRISTPE